MIYLHKHCALTFFGQLFSYFVNLFTTKISFFMIEFQWKFISQRIVYYFIHFIYDFYYKQQLSLKNNKETNKYHFHSMYSTIFVRLAFSFVTQLISSIITYSSAHTVNIEDQCKFKWNLNPDYSKLRPNDHRQANSKD